MSHHRVRKWSAVLAGCALALTAAGRMPAGASPADHPGSVSAAPVLDWSRYATQAMTGRPPASSEVQLGIVHAAIADTVAALGHGRPFLADVRPDRRASASAAVATAAYDVLRARVPAQQPYLDATYGEYLAAVPDGAAKERGIRLGRTVAGAVLGWRAGDGLDATVPYLQRTPGPGVWEPTAPSAPVDIVLTRVRPLALRSADQFRPAGPDPLTSRRYARDVAEVAALGRADSTVRTAAQTATAMFWSDHAGQQWSRSLLALAADRRLSLGSAARMLAQVHVTAADALIGCWSAKFHYGSWRPVHAIQRGDSDGNPATAADPSWTSLLNVNHPEYPSGHACFTAAATHALAAYFGTDRVRMEFSSTPTGTSRVYQRLSAVRTEVREARIVSGLHFRHAMTDGESLGARVGAWVDSHYRAAR